MRKLSILLCMALIGIGALGVFLGNPFGCQGGDVLVHRAAPDDGDGSSAARLGDGAASGSVKSPDGSNGDGSFDFGNPYLDGRSRWCWRRYREEREALRSMETPPEPVIECRVHREPFTEGEWIRDLSEELGAQREDVEHHAVESVVTFFVPGVDAVRVAWFIAASSYLETLPGEGVIERESLFPPLSLPLEGLRDVPSLKESQWLTRVRWDRSMPLAKPTALYYLNAVIRDGECLALIDEAWRNFGDESHAVVRMATAQHAILPRGTGCLVRITNFYSGQSIPPLMDGFVVRLTVAFYEKVARAVIEGARDWTPPRDVVALFERAGIHAP